MAKEAWNRDAAGIPHGIVRLKTTIGDAFGVSRQTVDRWDFPRRPDGGYDLHEIHEWRLRRQKSRLPLNSAQTRKAAAEAEIKELEAEKRRRELANMDADWVDRGDVTRFVGKFFLVAKDLIQRIPEELSPSWPADQRALIREGLEDRISAYLHSVHAYCDRVAEIGEEE